MSADWKICRSSAWELHNLALDTITAVADNRTMAGSRRVLASDSFNGLDLEINNCVLGPCIPQSSTSRVVCMTQLRNSVVYLGFLQ